MLEFKPPKVPYAWLATTFIAPLLVVVIPQVIERSASLTTLIIIALAMLSVLLFVMWLITHFQLYNEAFARQLIERELTVLEARMTKVESSREYVLDTIHTVSEEGEQE